MGQGGGLLPSGHAIRIAFDPSACLTGPIDRGRVRLLLPALASAVVAATLPATTGFAAMPLSIGVSGNHLVDGNGLTTRLLGVNRSGTDYACIQGWGIFDGSKDATSVAAMASW